MSQRNSADEARAVRAMLQAFLEEGEKIAQHIERVGAGHAVDGMVDPVKDRETLRAADRLGSLAEVFTNSAKGVVMGYVIRYCDGGANALKVAALKEELDHDLNGYIAGFEAIANGKVD